MKRRIKCIKDNQLTLSLISFIHFGGLGHFKPINILDPMILMKWRKKEAKTGIKKGKKHILSQGKSICLKRKSIPLVQAFKSGVETEWKSISLRRKSISSVQFSKK